ncbi:minor tail protein [Streptomyces phage Rooney]|nr:hypothetical protein SEA_GIBSON_24 [Streptomyces phage Gibson]QYW07281.1 minor tail protein [Streptomyces phage Rooney]
MPSLPPPIKGELFYDGVWNSASVRTTSTIEITRGLTSESNTEAEPTTCECDLDSRDLLYAPRNPESPLYGKIGRNTPFRLSLEAGGAYFTSSGTTGIFSFSTPDNAAFDITGDLDLRLDCRADDWYDPQTMAVRYTPGTVAFALAVNGDGYLYFWWTPSTGTRYAKSTVPVAFHNGERAVIRVTVDVDNGSSQSEVRFWHSKAIDADEWTMIGDSVTQSTAAPFQNISGSIYLADNQLSLLPDSSSGTDRFRGEVYGFQLWDGFNDQLKVDLDTARDGGEDAVGGTTIVDETGFTWTRSGNSSFKNQYYRSVGEVPAWPPTRDLTGNDNIVSISPTGITRRMDAGNKPIDSALLRYIRVNNPDECWPMTDPAGSTQGFAASLVGGPDLAYVPGFYVDDLDPPQFGNKSIADWIENVTLVKVDNGATFIGSLPGGTATSGEWTFDIFLNTGGKYQTNDKWIFKDSGEGTDASPRVEITVALLGDDDGSSGRWFSVLWSVYTTDASSLGLFFSNTVPAQGDAFFDPTVPHHVRTKVEWDSSEITLTLYSDGEFVNSGSTVFGMKPVSTVQIDISNSFFADLDKFDQGVGYATFWRDNTAPSVTELYQAMLGFPGETTSERILRLASENNYVASISGQADEEATLSLQERDKLLALLQSASDANFGYLLERRDALEIYHRGQSTLWNQAPVFTLDFSDGVVGAPFKPVDDDKLTENDVTVSAKRAGSPARYVLEEGELSVQDFPDGVGRYDQDYEYIYDNNTDINDAAYMRLHLGTYNGVRYTRITLDLANKRVYAMLHKILRADVGDKIRLLNIPKDHGPGPVDVIIQGYSESIGPDEWRIVFNCIPGEPWTAGQVYSDGEANVHARLDTAGCVTGDTATTTDSEIELFTTAEFHWTSDLYDSPYDIRVGGEVVTVLGPAGPINDEVLFDTSISPWVAQNGTSVWSQEVVHPDPRARGSLKFTPSGGFSAGGPLSELSPVGTIEPGVVYAIGAWVYSPNGFSDFRAVADWYDSSGTYLSTSGATPVVAPARDWVWVSATPTAPANADRYRIRIRYGAAADADDVYYVWAARLTSVSASAVRDTFTRTLSDSWGTSESGAVWTNTGGASTDYDTTGSAGTHTLTSANTSRYSVTPANYADQDVRAHVSTSALATGASQYAGVVARYLDTNNTYYGRIAFQTNQAVSLTIQKRVAGAQTDLVTVTLPWTHTVNGVFGVRLLVQGSTLKAKAWPVATTTEPRIWHAETTDTSLTAAGSVGVRSITGSGNTNTNPVFSYDNFETVRNQRFAVTRSENNVVKSHVTGEDARLAVPSYVQM